MKCVYTPYGEDFQCGKPAERSWGLYLCGEHLSEVREYRVGVMAQSAKTVGVDKFPGFCYMVLLPDGSVKVGYSNTEELLEKRLKSLNRGQDAPVVKLAVFPGGFVAESLLHRRFREYRLPGSGERFRYSPEMAEFINDPVFP